jgi:hypothetical protein
MAIYLIDNSPKASHFSYHTDGNCFYHSGEMRHTKKIRKPLIQFEGIESLVCANVMLFDISTRETKRPKIKTNNFVFERNAPFCFEIILSKNTFALPAIPERINSEYQQKKIGHLYLTLEVFENNSKYIADNRYSPNTWVVGENFFVEIDGKWK